jgi:hypothetical protein
MLNSECHCISLLVKAPFFAWVLLINSLIYCDSLMYRHIYIPVDQKDASKMRNDVIKHIFCYLSPWSHSASCNKRLPTNEMEVSVDRLLHYKNSYSCLATRPGVEERRDLERRMGIICKTCIFPVKNDGKI